MNDKKDRGNKYRSKSVRVKIPEANRRENGSLTQK
jgi:hypothetical protein